MHLCPRDMTLNDLQPILAKRRLRLTRLRAEVWKVFREKEHITAQELHQLLSMQNMQIGLTAIYRTLNCFCGAGLAQVCHFGERSVYVKDSRKGHDAYLICTSCGRIVGFKNGTIQRLQEEVARHHGFTIERHRLEIHGLCANCRG